MMDHFDRNNTRIVREKLQEAVRGIEEELGIQIKFGNASFSNSIVTIKTECAIKGAEGEIVGQAAEDFKKLAELYGLKPDDLGKEFDHMRDTFTIIGLKPKSKKYPILAKEKYSKKVFKFPARAVNCVTLRDPNTSRTRGN